ncbi:DUF3344 domain-containing protein [Streptomyces sp. NBC_01497]|uniref:DUF3344 domain-containing protein n=1 Tax=Streptomyces sp. NBC_01497 TaxID=2903885 RepID=UPI002E370221|nr:DUF3344 domain-containing protein [Streptomyces sp. NBC_01497]
MRTSVMRTSAFPGAWRGLLCACAAGLLAAAGAPQAALAQGAVVRDAVRPAPVGPGAHRPGPAPALAAAPGPVRPVAREAARIPFRARFSAVQHGGIVRAGNTAVRCRTTCPAVRGGRGAGNQDADMSYADVDSDPNTYNSSRADLAIPDGATVSSARLYWGGNLRVGEQKPVADAGRVLVAEPGGEYREVLADTVLGHRRTAAADVYQASADVTGLVRGAGPGMYTVAQADVARGRSAVGAFGGWTLVVAYEKADEPLRRLALWDGFEALDSGHRSVAVQVPMSTVPKRAAGRFGLVAYDGDRGVTGDSVTVATDKGRAVPLSDKANGLHDVMNSSITDLGVDRIKRQPFYANNRGYDSDVFDLTPALTAGGQRLGVRFDAGRDSLWVGAFFVQTAVRD